MKGETKRFMYLEAGSYAFPNLQARRKNKIDQDKIAKKPYLT